jgi:hypothetical protein
MSELFDDLKYLIYPEVISLGPARIIKRNCLTTHVFVVSQSNWKENILNGVYRNIIVFKRDKWGAYKISLIELEYLTDLLQLPGPRCPMTNKKK